MHRVQELLLCLQDLCILIGECAVDEHLPCLQRLDGAFNVWRLLVDLFERLESVQHDLNMLLVLHSFLEYLVQEVDFVLVVVYVIHSLQSTQNVLQVPVQLFRPVSNEIHGPRVQIFNLLAKFIQLSVHAKELILRLPMADHFLALVEGLIDFLELFDDLLLHLDVLVLEV